MPQESFRDAQLLIEFLNFDSSQIDRPRRLAGGELALSLPPMFQVLFSHRLKSARQLPKLMKEVAALQDEMKKDLAPLAGKDAVGHLKSLIDKINRMKLHARFALLAVDNHWPEPKEVKPSAVFNLRGTTFELSGRRWSVAFDRLQLDTSLRREWYLLFATVLERGEMERIGHCPRCQKFFFRKDRRAGFCSTPCRYGYSNEQRRKVGYFKNWYQGEKQARRKSRRR